MTVKNFQELISSLNPSIIFKLDEGLDILNLLSQNFEEKEKMKKELMEVELEFNRIDNELQIEIGKDTRLTNDAQRRSALNIKRVADSRWVELKETLIPDYKAQVERAQFNESQLNKVFSLYMNAKPVEAEVTLE